MSFADGSVSDSVMVSSSGDITLQAGPETRHTGPFNWIFYGFQNADHTESDKDTQIQ